MDGRSPNRSSHADNRQQQSLKDRTEAILSAHPNLPAEVVSLINDSQSNAAARELDDELEAEIVVVGSSRLPNSEGDTRIPLVGAKQFSSAQQRLNLSKTHVLQTGEKKKHLERIRIPAKQREYRNCSQYRHCRVPQNELFLHGSSGKLSITKKLPKSKNVGRLIKTFESMSLQQLRQHEYQFLCQENEIKANGQECVVNKDKLCLRAESTPAPVPTNFSNTDTVCTAQISVEMNIASDFPGYDNAKIARKKETIKKLDNNLFYNSPMKANTNASNAKPVTKKVYELEGASSSSQSFHPTPPWCNLKVLVVRELSIMFFVSLYSVTY